MMNRIAKMSCAALLIAAVGSSDAAAQESLQTVKELYAAAAYEDALAAANKLQTDQPKGDLEQYRVFSLTALGRHDEAQKAMEAMLRADPSYALDPAETPPRVQEAFSKVRQRMLPVVTKQLYTDARAALDRKDRGEAVAQFEKLLKIIDASGPAAASLGEMRVLAEGFLDLSRALPGPAPAVDATKTVSAPASPTPDPSSASAAATRTPAAPSTTTTQVGRTSTGSAPSNGSARTPGATPGPVPRASVAGAVTSAAETRPFPLSQGLPAWSPTDALSRRSTFSGAVMVRINSQGRVDSAEITRSVHPTYDPILLRAARTWRYQPATRNGQPVESELTVEVNLRPTQ